MDNTGKQLKTISNKLSFLIRLLVKKENFSSASTPKILESLKDYDFEDEDVSTMFGLSKKTLQNRRSERRVKNK